ncbi:sugar transferase [Limnochorda pilosa]|nr:sugar transferase [Limnochorda pilosa]
MTYTRNARQRWLYDVLGIAGDGTASVLAIMLASYTAWYTVEVWRQRLIWPDVAVLWAMIVIGKAWLLRRPNRTPMDQLRAATLWVGAVYGAVMAYVLLARSYYSRSFLLVSLVVLLLWQMIDILLLRPRTSPTRLAAVPSSIMDKLSVLPGLDLVPLSGPRLHEPVAGLVVDMHEALPPEWQRFVAECAASGLPVYHAAAVYETASTRVPLSHLSDGWVGDLFNGPATYLPLKRFVDVAAVLVTLPVTVPICLLTALAIKLDSAGPLLFWQDRVGQRGQVFRLVKFRSMRVDAESDGARFALDGDHRITRVGRVIRRLRVDELPQLWNVLRGEMSLIGPRPEQVSFVREFERKIPFYSWRHRVKPGITGWAQVQQGYAAGLEDTTEKLEYDLYYVKHVSFWLDLSIALKTIRVMLTGRGAR